MKVPFKIGDKSFEIKAYNTAQEKELLLLDSFGVQDLDNVFEILNFEHHGELSIDEKKVILYKHREVSIGDEVDIKYVCDNCSQVNETVIPANGFVCEPKHNDPDIKTKSVPFDENKMSEYVDIDIDELDIDEYETLKRRIIDNQIVIDFTKKTKCVKCGNLKNFNMGDLKYIIEIMSEDTLMTLFKTYNYLNFFGHYSKLDIDSMYPFERSVFVGLLNKTKEDLAK